VETEISATESLEEYFPPKKEIPRDPLFLAGQPILPIFNLPEISLLPSPIKPNTDSLHLTIQTPISQRIDKRSSICFKPTPNSSTKKRQEVSFQLALSPRPSPFIRNRNYSFQQIIFSPLTRKIFTSEYEGTFAGVPNEILQLIFTFFDSDRDLLSVGCVSKRWNFQSSSSNLWQALYILHWEIPDRPLKSNQSWKSLFIKRNNEFLMSQISLDRSYGYSRKKILRTDHLLTPDLPKETWRPEKKD